MHVHVVNDEIGQMMMQKVNEKPVAFRKTVSVESRCCPPETSRVKRTLAQPAKCLAFALAVSASCICCFVTTSFSSAAYSVHQMATCVAEQCCITHDGISLHVALCSAAALSAHGCRR